MKGVVFNLVESFICDGWGEDKYEEILSLCPLKTKEPFVGPGTYPDSDLMLMVTKAAEILGVEVEDAVRAFGHYCFPKLSAKLPELVARHDHPFDFLMSVEDAIHVEVRKLMPNALTPSFRYRREDETHMVLEYRSPRKLCAFLEGLLDGVAEHFKVEIRREHALCMHNGHDCCEFRLVLAQESRAA